MFQTIYIYIFTTYPLHHINCYWFNINRGRTNRVFGKPCFCPLPKRGRFDENGENDEFAFYPLKTRFWLLRPPKTTKMTKMAGVTQEKAWFRKGRVCSSLNQIHYANITLHKLFSDASMHCATLLPSILYLWSSGSASPALALDSSGSLQPWLSLVSGSLSLYLSLSLSFSSLFLSLSLSFSSRVLFLSLSLPLSLSLSLSKALFLSMLISRL